MMDSGRGPALARRCALGSWALALSVVACGGAATPGARGPAAVAPSAAPSPRESAAPVAPAAPRRALDEPPPGTPPAPASCDAFAARTPAAATCADREQSIGWLARALAQTEPGQRDAALAGAESCAALPRGLARALRAELAPVECGDRLVADYVEAEKDLDPSVRNVLVALGLAGRISRLVHDPPRLEGKVTREAFGPYFKDRLAPWVGQQAHALEVLSIVGSRLPGYAKAVVAVEAGLADLRFVEEVRGVQLPEELAKDSELRDAYYSSLDQALDPRKERGRDAALAGLRLFYEVGTLGDPRVDRARSLLSKLYGGRRIDALDGLLLPPAPAPSADRPELLLAEQLPTFYAGLLLGDLDVTQAGVLPSFYARGVPLSARKKLESAALGTDTRDLWARTLFAYGQRYYRASDFARAAELAQIGAKEKGAAADAARLFAALGHALAGGPKDAVDMMASGPVLPGGMADVVELDAVSRGKGAAAAFAAYDAAYLLEIASPDREKPEFWDDLAVRWDRAAKLLTTPAHKREAKKRAEAARATAKAARAARPSEGGPLGARH